MRGYVTFSGWEAFYQDLHLTSLPQGMGQKTERKKILSYVSYICVFPHFLVSPPPLKKVFHFNNNCKHFKTVFLADLFRFRFTGTVT